MPAQLRGRLRGCCHARHAQLATSLRELESQNYELITTGFSEGELQNILEMATFTPPVVGADGDAELDAMGAEAHAAKGAALRFSQEQWSKLTTALGVDDPDQVVAAVLRLVEAPADE